MCWCLYRRQDAEHWGILLKDVACGLLYIPGYNNEKREEFDVNRDEGIITEVEI